MTRAMILAAGRGTRLHPLTEELPKPLVPVGDRPMIAHIAERLAKAGITRAILNVFHHADAFTPEVLASLPIPLEVVRETMLLGTAGGVANARAALGEGEIVVWNGDILADVDVAALLAAHVEAGDAEATMAYAPRAAGEGTLGLGRRGEVVRLRGERFGDEVTGGDFLGVHVLGPVFRSGLPIPGCLTADGYLPALRRGARVASFAVSGAWDDVGTVAAYLAANAHWLAQRGANFVAATACVGPDIEVRGSSVGEGATVTGSGELAGCVVWPGAHAVAPLRDAVVTPKNLVRL